MIKFADVDVSNWRIDLSVSPEQKVHVADCTTLLARAYAYRNVRSKAYVIYDDDTPIGMSLYYDEPDLNAYVFSQFFIDSRYQGKGYGRTATEMILNEMKQDGKYEKVVLCYVEGNSAAKCLYEKFGFVETDRDEDEIIMELQLD